MEPIERRFWVCVSRRLPDECWPWIPPAPTAGYGQFKVYAGELDVPEDFCTPSGLRYRGILAHRVAFRFVHGHWPMPCALHGCDNPPCCNTENPRHVHEGTHSQNSLEMFERDRQPARMRSGEAHYRATRSAAQVEAVRARFAAGETTQVQLAAEYGVRQGTVSRWVRGLRFATADHPPLPVVPRKHAVLDPGLRSAVKARRAAGISQQQIADELGIGQSSVSRIIRLG